MSIRHLFQILFVLVCIISCAVMKPGLVNQAKFLEIADPMSVQGRQGLAFAKILQFGEFHTSEFRLGSANKMNDLPSKFHFDFWDTKYTQVTQKFAFKQFDSLNDSLEVLCLYNAETKNTLYYNKMNSTKVIKNDFVIKLFKNGIEHELISSKDSITDLWVNEKKISIQFESSNDRSTNTYFNGFLFICDGQTLGAVSTINNGLVWIRKDLDPQIKLYVAALSTAFLVSPQRQSKSLIDNMRP